MRKIILMLLISLFFVSCAKPKAEAADISNDTILHFIYENYMLPTKDILTFDEFKSYIKFSREDHDINEDDALEVVFSVKFPLQKGVYIFIFSLDNERKPIEIFFTKQFGWYSFNYQISFLDHYMILDYLLEGGGTGVHGLTWNREIVRCQKDLCDSIRYTQLDNSFASGYGGYGSSNGMEIGKLEVANSVLSVWTYQYSDVDYAIHNSCFGENSEKYGGEEYKNKKLLGPVLYNQYAWRDGMFSKEIERIENPQIIEDRFVSADEGVSNIYNFFRFRVFPEEELPKSALIEYRKFWGAEGQYLSKCEPFENTREPRPITLSGNAFYKNGVKVADVEVINYGGDWTEFGPVNICRLKAWKNLDYQTMDALSDIEVIDTVDFFCDADYTQIFSEDIDNNGNTELLVLTLDPEKSFFQILRVFQLTDRLEKVAEISGFLREPNFRGIEWERRNDQFVLLVGQPISQPDCKYEFSCYTFDKPYAKYIWSLELDKLVEIEE